MLTSLRGKLMLIFLTITLSSVMISSGYARYIQRQLALEQAAKMADENLQQIASELNTILQWVQKDLFFLRDLNLLKNYFDATNATDKQKSLDAIEDTFHTLADNHGIFHQVRFLDTRGMEIVRINSDGRQSYIVSADELQNKAHRDYYQKAITMEEGQTYISPMDLNIEEGIIEIPFLPVIRYATPVFDNKNELRGIVIINVLGNKILNILDRQKSFTPHGKTYLINSSGYYLHHPQKDKTFGFMTNDGEVFGKEEPELSNWLHQDESDVAVKHSSATGIKTMFAYRKIPLLSIAEQTVSKFYEDNVQQSGAYWVLLNTVTEEDLIVGFDRYSRTFILFNLLLLAVCAIIAMLVSLGVSRPVISLAKAAMKITKGDFSARAVIYSCDEMGQFGQLFNRMASHLEKSVEKISKSELKYRQLFENSRDSFFVIDLSCRIEDINVAGIHLLGINTDEFPLHLSLSCCQKGSDENALLMEKISSAGYVKDYEAQLVRPDGTVKICLMTATARREENGTIIGYEGVLRDITKERKRAEEERSFQKRLQEEIVLAEERERRAVSTALHEELAQNLALVHLKVQEAEKDVSESDCSGLDNQVKKDLVVCRDLLNNMIKQIRTMIFELYPVILEEQGFLPAIKWYGENFTDRTSLPVSIYELEEKVEPLGHLRIYLFRSFKELLHNIWKHAEATEVVVTVLNHSDMLKFVVYDDGKGFEVEDVFDTFPSQERGIGLFSIREWVRIEGGILSIESESGLGTRVSIEVPLTTQKGK